MFYLNSKYCKDVDFSLEVWHIDNNQIALTSACTNISILLGISRAAKYFNVNPHQN